MKIQDLNSINRIANAKRKKASGGGGDFSVLLDTEEESPVAPVSATPYASNISQLLMLQEVGQDDQDLTEKSKARGKQMLEYLDEVRLGLLNGALSKAKIKELQELVSNNKLTVSDPNLRDILAQVEVLAAVELAKLEREENI
jgi:hypothetical protein